MKRILLTCSVAMLSVALSAQGLLSRYDFKVDDIYYQYESKTDYTVKVSYDKTGSYSGEVVIPATVFYENATYSVVGIGEGTFSGCFYLTSVTIPRSVTYLEAMVFTYCPSLTTIYSLNPEPPTCETGYNPAISFSTENCVLYVPAGRKDAYAEADGWKEFANIVEMEDIALVVETLAPTDVTTTTATLHGSVTASDEEILEQGFEYWSATDDVETVVVADLVDGEMSAIVEGLTESTIYTYRAYATTMSGPTYGEDLSFTTSSSTFYEDGLYYNVTSGMDFTVEVTWGGEEYDSGTESYVGHIVVPETVEYNGTPYRVTRIGDYAFYKCELTSIDLPNTITSLGWFALRDCASITSLTLPESLESMEYMAVAYCKDLTSIKIPDSVTSMGECVFAHCTSMTEATIGKGLDTIYPMTFTYCEGLSTVNIPTSVHTIGSNAFFNCHSLESIDIPNSVTLIDGSAFMQSGLKSINIPNSVVTIGGAAFMDCESLTSVVIPNSVTTIGATAFAECANLADLTLGESIENIGGQAFQNCVSLQSIEIPPLVVGIASSTFRGCAGLTSVTLPSGLVEIEYYAFCDCNNLPEITLPATTTLLWNDVFTDCTNLKKVYSLNPEPPAFYIGNAFVGINDECVLYVPQGSYDAYSSAQYWKEFFSIEEIDTTGIDTVWSEGETAICGYYSVDGQLLNAPQKGVNIVRFLDGTTKKILVK